MNLSDFDYNLPGELIAQSPANPRDNSRLLVLDKKNGRMDHRKFFNIIDYLNPGDLMIMNNTRVIPARLLGKKELTHGKVEILLHRQIDDNTWEAMGKNLKIGGRIIFDNSKLKAVPEKKNDDLYIVRFNMGGKVPRSEFEKIGLVPIPPYIRGGKSTKKDSTSYQTVYAKHKGSVAAPTAGLHFTHGLLKRIQEHGVAIDFVTLHVGLGTFAPIKTTTIKEHKMHSEYFEISKQLVKRINDTKKNGGRIVAVGTTSARVLETVFREYKVSSRKHKSSVREIIPKIKESEKIISGWTNIFIYPGYRFKCVDAIITNFHLPKSTLLLLVSALAGAGNIKRAYNQAITMEYRFYSYGDAMFII